jgi:hypothetical protein
MVSAYEYVCLFILCAFPLSFLLQFLFFRITPAQANACQIFKSIGRIVSIDLTKVYLPFFEKEIYRGVINNMPTNSLVTFDFGDSFFAQETKNSLKLIFHL